MIAFLYQDEANSKQSSESPCTALCWNKSSDLLATGRVDGTAQIQSVPLQNRKTGPNPANSNQDLVNHQVAVRCIAWSPKHDIVATGDVDGIVTVWRQDEKTEAWENFMATRAVQKAVSGMEWTKDGDRICIVYENGSVMVGKIDGMKLWSLEVNDARIPTWSPDGDILLIGTSQGQILIFDKSANNIGFVILTPKPEEKPSEKPLTALTWTSPSHAHHSSSTPTIAVTFEDGKCYLLRNEEDRAPIRLRVPMTVWSADWSADGSKLAIGGRVRKTPTAPDESAQFSIYSPFGQLEYTIKLRYSRLTNLSWDSSGTRVALLLDGTVNFLNIKYPVKHCFFENTLVYTCAKEENRDALVVMFSCKTERKVAVKHYPGQRVLSLAAGADFCVVAAKIIQEINQFNLSVLTDTGATANVTSMLIEPFFAAANDSQVFVASKEVLFVWNFKQTNLSNRWDSNERYFHIDEAHGFVDWKVKRQRLYEASIDPICAIACSNSVLVVGRESGSVARYALPQMMWEREYSAVLPASTKLGLNADSSRLLCMNGEGQCCMYVLSETRMGKDDVVVKDVKIGVEKEGVWDFVWASDDADLFAVAHKHRAIIFRNREPEEPIVGSGYFCQFKNLELRVAHLDDLLRSTPPTDPGPSCTKLLRVKSLRQALQLLDSSSLSEAQSFVSTHPHPVLWNLVADKALQKLQLDEAGTCYVHGQNYRGLKFVQKLKRIKSEKIRQAEVSAHFGDLYRAEQELIEANRTDLAHDMRRISGDWFRLNEMALEGHNDVMLKESFEGLGKYYVDRQLWGDAVKNYEDAKDYESLFKTHLMAGDTEKLQDLAEILPAGHHLLVDIGTFLGRSGNSKAAAKSLRKVDRPDLAIKICLDNFDFQTAMEISRAFDLDDYPPATIKALSIKTIETQIASQEGSQALWAASNLYHSAGLFLESANYLFQVLAKEAVDKEADVHHLKKISVLAASAVEEYNKTSSSSLLGQQVFPPDDSSALDFIFLEAPWRSAEAYNLLIVAQAFYDQGDYPKALRAAGTLCLYQDILDPVQIFSLIALASVQLKRWDVVNEAIIRVVNMESTDPKVAEEIERFADDLFTKHSPKDVDLDAPLPSPLCLNCKERISLWDIRCQGCGTKYPLCMVTGSPITEKEVWQCQFCHHHSAASVALQRKTCALCHSPG